MNKTKYYFLLVGIIVFVWGCQKPNQCVIKGKITHAEGQMIYLDELFVTNSEAIDSVKIDKKGEFEFKSNVSIPTFYLLKLSDNKFITLLVDSTENVTVEADAANFSEEYKVGGSLGSLLVKSLNEKLNNTKQQLDSIASLNALNQGRIDYNVIKAQNDIAYNKIVQDQVDYSTEFVRTNAFSMASVLALYQKFDDNNYVVKDLQPLKVAASALNSIYPQSPLVKSLYENTLKLMKEEKAMLVQRMIEEQGENSPDITLPNVDGEDVKLSSLRGKVVLLHFWAASNPNSRIINPVLVEVYKQYKKKGFEIYQVSIDTDRFEWIEGIEKDKLTWINVGDMKGSVVPTRTYNVTEIPFNYLLDKEGVIIGKNLKGPGLVSKLNELFN